MTVVLQQTQLSTTPQKLIASAMDAIGARSPGEPIDPNLENAAFYMLNDMLDMWSNDHMMVYYISEIIHDISNATAWTIGLNGGQINVARPLRINYAFVRINNAVASTLDFEVKVVNLAQYYPIGLKQLPGAWARILYYQPTFPLGTLTFWPLASVGEIHMFADTLLPNFATVNDVVQLPQGFNMAIRWNLAEMLMPSYGRNDQAIAAQIRKFATSSKAWIKRTNAQPPPQSRFDGALLRQRGNDAAWIFSGGQGS